VKMHKLYVVDLFSGCGGLTEGFEQTGNYQTIAGVEWDKAARCTLVERLSSKWNSLDAEERIAHFDIQRTEELFRGWKDDPKYGSHVGLDTLIGKRKVDIVVGGPPCQAYSIAGRVRDKHGMRYDYRNFLFESYLKVVSRYKPKLIVFENVPGMLSAKPGDVAITERIQQAFEQENYHIPSELRKVALFDFSEYSVPQKRTRVIIVGVNKSMVRKPEEVIEKIYSALRSKASMETVTVNQAIGDLLPFYPAQKVKVSDGKKYSHEPINSKTNNHTPRFHNTRDIEIFRVLAEDIRSGNNYYSSSEALKQLYTKMTGKTSNVHKYHVLRANKPSNTIPAHLYKDGLRHIHPDPAQARSITVREAARLQGFEDDFNFCGSIGDQYKMIGNAVPPIFARQLAEVIAEYC